MSDLFTSHAAAAAFHLPQVDWQALLAFAEAKGPAEVDFVKGLIAVVGGGNVGAIIAYLAANAQTQAAVIAEFWSLVNGTPPAAA